MSFSRPAKRVAVLALVLLVPGILVRGASGSVGGDEGPNVIAGRVMDEEGNPVSGATVSAWPAGSGSGFGTVQTDANGSYRLENLPSRDVVVRVLADGLIGELWGEVRCWLGACSPRDGVAISLTDGIEVTGIDFALANGSHISGHVRALDGTPITDGAVIDSIFDSLVLDADGRFVTQALIEGSYFVRTSVAGFVDELYSGLPCEPVCQVTSGTPIKVDGTEVVSGIDFFLTPFGSIEGRVVDEESGLPLDRHRVSAVNESDEIVAHATTDDRGGYTMSVAPGLYRVVAESPEHHLSQLFDGIPCPDGPCDVSLGDPIEVKSAETTGDIDFALARRGSIQGIVVARDTGLPIAGAFVFFSNAETLLPEQRVTDEEGRYRFSSGIESASWFVSVGAPSPYLGALYPSLPCWDLGLQRCDVTTGTAVTVQPGADLEINFVLERGSRVSGRIVDTSTGNLLLSGALIIDAETGANQALLEGGTIGSFAGSRIPPGTYYVVTRAAGSHLQESYDDVRCTSPDPLVCGPTGMPIVVADFDSEVIGIDFALDHLPRVLGVVRDRNGAPVGAKLRLISSGGTFAASARSASSSGRFGLAAEPGSYALHVSARGFESQIFDGIPCDLPCDAFFDGTPIVFGAPNSTTAGLEVRMRRLGALGGTIRDTSTGLPIVGATVRIWGERRPLDVLTTNADGRFDTGPLRAGDYRVAIGRVGYRSEVYAEHPCPGPSTTCDSNLGQPVPVRLDEVADLAIDLLPLEALVFGDGFESGDADSWSAIVP